MQLYKITYKQLIEEDCFTLYDRENSILKYLETDEYKNHKILMVNSFDFTEELDIGDYSKTYLEFTEAIRDFIIANKPVFENWGSCNLYIDYTLEPSTNEEWTRCIEADLMNTTEFERLVPITEEQFEKALLSMSAYEDDMTEEEREQAELLMDQIDSWMAKGRESLRAEQRGDKYLQDIKNSD